jgi:hypothetical protein
MRKFTVERRRDESGISGVGVIIEGVVFSNGQVVVHWLTPPPHGSITIWPSFDDFQRIHIDSHPTNGTIVKFADGEIIDQDA